MQVWGHRGYRAKYPENTLLSFTKALESGAQGIELDIQKTKDGKFVVIHDESVDRTTNDSGAVREFYLQDIQQLDAGSEEQILEISQLFEKLLHYKGITINVELKKETIERDDFVGLNNIFSPFRNQYRILISSFNHDLLEPYGEAGYPIGLLIGKEHQKAGILKLKRTIKRLKPSHINLPIQIFRFIPWFIRTVFFSYLKRRNIKLVFWTVNRQRELKKIKNLASAVITDDPSKMVSWVEQIRN